MAKGMAARGATQKHKVQKGKKVNVLTKIWDKWCFGVSPKMLTPSGQNPLMGNGCIATSLNGKPCPGKRKDEHMPYCPRCMKTGDPSLAVVKHPKFGKCLIARRNLKKGYTAVWWGRRMNSKTIPKKNMEWALTTPPYGIIDAVPFKESSQLQYCQCPGPEEKPTIDFAPEGLCDVLLEYKPTTCRAFQTLCDVPKNNQLTMMYSWNEKATEQFFKEMGIKRSNVGFPKAPALKKGRSSR